ncbi:MAG: 4Fe-4S dicluster domain-containing protein [Euryarchaeota archaeon]|nr:4Fe-4S dicluster domain-containing protein [Euryarchaeota archaeon]
MRVSYIKLADCSGCMINFLDVLSLDYIELVYCPNLIDNRTLQQADIGFVSGSVCMEFKEHISILKELREKCRHIVTVGSCACVGGITRFCRGDQLPQTGHKTFLPVSEVIEVDYAIPGCPASTMILKKFVEAYHKGNEKYLLPFKNLVKKKRASGQDLQDEIVSAGLCVGCGMCALSCPVEAIEMIKGLPEVRMDKCIRCGTCYFRCPRNFLKLRKENAEVI